MGIFSKIFGKKENNFSSTPSKDSSVPNIEISWNVEVNNEIPPLQGDYAKTIFLWAFSKASPIRPKSEYAAYFLYECGIQNASAYHRQMIDEGYFATSSTEDKLQSLKVAELKEILTSLGLTATGKKAVLVQRILENASSELLSHFFTEETYSLTDKGAVFLAEHEDYVKLHKHKTWGIDWQEYDSKHKPGFSFYDTVSRIFNERIIQDSQNFGRSEYFFMYQLLEEEGKRSNALEMLLRVLYIDLSGIEGSSSYYLYKEGVETLKELEEHFSIAIMLAPGIIKTIADYKDVFSDIMIDHLYEWRLPMQVCSKGLFTRIIHSLMENTLDEKAIETELKKAYCKAIRKL